MSTIEIKVPALPESIADATIAKWYKQPGDVVKRDENLVDLETDKVMLGVPAIQEGVLEQILKKEGEKVKANEVLAIIKTGAVGQTEKKAAPAQQAAPQAQKEAAKSESGPSARRVAAEHEVDIEKVKGTGREGRVTKEDVSDYVKTQQTDTKPSKPSSETQPRETLDLGERPEKRVPMSRLRARIAERLVEAQHNAAMLTTFNEVNMKPIMDLRTTYKDAFEKLHGVKLGFMSFFVKAAVEALKRSPAVNASIDGQDVVYHGYYDIGIAVSTERGLVVPVIRDADKLSMAGIEKVIAEFAEKARTNKLTIEEITGGTFTITNGGIFGSMLSTPILNPPQSAILGMHNIVKRPVVENDQVIIRPIMYLALSYDHRLIDGRESVTFLVTIKQFLEDPTRLLLEI
jgi:2-oxoglutarate dehydrogenase E2 component (dihydrolipoamide succinyltransferase)